jgi:2-amino-4-hydroxy-6-hydroxymethyldihydropteridine diphosphokinase
VIRTAYLGLGSNVGDRPDHLRAAVAALRAHGVDVQAVSSTYETEPMGEVLDQPDFLNAVVRVRTDLEPHDLLDLCKAIEVERGRMLAGQRHGPRPLDPDLSLPDGTVLREALSSLGGAQRVVLAGSL